MSDKPYNEIIEYLNAPIKDSEDKPYEVVDHEIETLLNNIRSEKWKMEKLLYSIATDKDRINCGLGIVNDLLNMYWRHYSEAMQWIKHLKQQVCTSEVFRLHFRKCVLLKEAILSVLPILSIKFGLLFPKDKIKLYENWHDNEVLNFPKDDPIVDNLRFYPLNVANEMKECNDVIEARIRTNGAIHSNPVTNEIVKSDTDQFLRFPYVEKIDIKEAFRILKEKNLISHETKQEHFLYWFGQDIEKPKDLKPINWLKPQALLSYFVCQFSRKIPKSGMTCPWKTTKEVFRVNNRSVNVNSMKTAKSKLEANERAYPRNYEIIDAILKMKK